MTNTSIAQLFETPSVQPEKAETQDVKAISPSQTKGQTTPAQVAAP